MKLRLTHYVVLGLCTVAIGASAFFGVTRNDDKKVSAAPTASFPASTADKIDASPKQGPIAGSTSTASPTLAGKEAVGSHGLTSVELERLVSWHRDRGTVIRIAGDGSVEKDPFSGYRSTDDAALRLLASQGDATAATVLGSRLAERYFSNRSANDLAEAKRLLLMSAAQGSTTSLTSLFETQLHVAVNRGIQLHKNAPAVNRAALVEAYQYLYLIEKRGDLSYNTYKDMAAFTGKLTDEETMQAKQKSETIYSAMLEERQKLGLPPFTNGIPNDIQQMVDRLMARANGG